MSPTVLRWPVADLRRVSWVLWEVRGTRQAAWGCVTRTHAVSRKRPWQPPRRVPRAIRHAPCAARRPRRRFFNARDHRVCKGAPGQAAALHRGGLRFAATALRCSGSWPVAQLTALTAFAAFKQARRVRGRSAARGHEPCAPQRLEGALPPAALREPSDQPLNNPRTTRPRPRVPGLAVSSLQIVTPGATCFDRLSTCRRYVPCV